MKTIAQTSLAFLLLISYGCGPGNTFTPHTVDKMEEKLIAKCLPAPTHNVNEVDRTVVVLSKSVVDRILGNLVKAIPYDISSFWSVLSEEDRDVLNFAVNSSLIKQRPENYQTVYRATALFFSKVMGNYKAGQDYRIQDISGKVISFVDGGVANAPIQDISSSCDFNSGLDLSYIKLPSSVIMIDEVKELVFCRLKDDRNFRFMHARNSFMMMSGDRIFKAKGREGVLDEGPGRLNLKVESIELNLILKMKKNSPLTIGDHIGNKTFIKVSVADLVTEEMGACHEQ